MKFPREILEDIFSHLDMKSSKEAILVCPSFYEPICYAQKNKPQCLVMYETNNLEVNYNFF